MTTLLGALAIILVAGALWFGYGYWVAAILLAIIAWRLTPHVRALIHRLAGEPDEGQPLPLLQYRQALSQCAPTLADHQQLRRIPVPAVAAPSAPANARDFFYWCHCRRFGDAERVVALLNRHSRLIGVLTDPQPVAVARACLAYNADRVISVHMRPQGTAASDVLFAARLYGFCQLLDIDYGGDWYCWHGEQGEHFIAALQKLQQRAG